MKASEFHFEQGQNVKIQTDFTCTLSTSYYIPVVVRNIKA